VTLPCRHVDTCGGGPLGTASYDEQLATTRARLAELVGVDVPPIIESPRTSAPRVRWCGTSATRLNELSVFGRLQYVMT
jgi:hypothetical protein